MGSKRAIQAGGWVIENMRSVVGGAVEKSMEAEQANINDGP